MKKILLAPAALVAAGAIALSGTPAFAETPAASDSATPSESGTPSATPSKTTEAPKAKTSTTPAAKETTEAPDGKNAKLNAKPTTISPKDIQNKNKGVKITGSGFKPGTYDIAATKDGKDIKGSLTADADEKGNVAFTYYLTVIGNPDITGKFVVQLVDSKGKKAGNAVSFTVGSAAKATPKKTAKAAAAKLTVSPKSVSAKKFVSKKDGVALAVSGLKQGTKVKFTITPSKKNVTPYVLTVTAGKDGVAKWAVYGTNAAKSSTYIGSYAVKAEVDGGKTFKGSFKVTSGKASAGSSDDNGSSDPGTSKDNGSSSNSGSELPRTGMELTGLAAGGALLLIGGATVLISRRKVRK